MFWCLCGMPSIRMPTELEANFQVRSRVKDGVGCVREGASCFVAMHGAISGASYGAAIFGFGSGLQTVLYAFFGSLCLMGL